VNVVPNQPLLSCEVDLLPPNNICSEPVGDFVPDEVVTVDVSGPSAIAAVIPIDVLMHSVKCIGIIYEAIIAIHMRH